MVKVAAYKKAGEGSVTTTEAAWLAELSPKTVNKTIDRGELPNVSRDRGLAPSDVLYLVIRCSVGEALTADAKRELYEKLNSLELSSFNVSSCKTPVGGVSLAGGMLRVNLRPACLKLSKRWRALDNAMSEVVSDPGIRSGEPVVRGTRVPVYVIADLIQQGADAKEILEDYPVLTASKVRAALAYAQTHPRRGRPRKEESADR